MSISSRCAQFLPGPASSQTGFAIGLMRGGRLGGLAAWAGFTLPSRRPHAAFAYGAGSLADSSWGAGLLHGLKLVAVAIVAQAVLGMARALCPDRPRASIATAALVLLLFAPGSLAQIGAIALGGAAGLALCRGGGEAIADERRHAGVPAPGRRLPRGVLRAAGLSFVPVEAACSRCSPPSIARAPWCSAAAMSCCRCCATRSWRRAGFPTTPSWRATARLRLLPGPLFTFAAYLGAVSGAPPAGARGRASSRSSRSSCRACWR